jgi:hypothetical protein
MRWIKSHQRPWLAPALWDSPALERAAAVDRLLAEKSRALNFSECILFVGGDQGYHLECRLIRDRIRDWHYELDCHELPPQSVILEEAEIEPLLDCLHDIEARDVSPETLLVEGPDSHARVLCVWYRVRRDRMLWLVQFPEPQEIALNLLKAIHHRLDQEFPIPR